MSKQHPPRLVAYCGLHCGLCAQRSRIPQQASQLRQTLHEEGFDDFYQHAPEMKDDFPSFSKFLQTLTNLDCSCRTGLGGPPDCEIRNCARRRRIAVCPQCSDYPCPRIQAMGERYPTLIQDGKRLQTVGIKQWIKEQEQRAKRGFTYADARYPS